LSKLKLEKKVLGKFALGPVMVELETDPNATGGWLSFLYEKKGARISIGTNATGFGRIYDVIMHEALEFAACQVCVRYRPDPDYADSSGGYYFAMNHEQFAEVVARASVFVRNTMWLVDEEYKRTEKLRKQIEKSKKKPKGKNGK
jgi:hypothetical protein